MTTTQRPYTLKSYQLQQQQQQQQQSTYLPTSSYRGNSSDSAASSSLPTTPPKIFHTLTNSSTNIKNSNDGYDSDSSEEGRKHAPPQLLGLRVINPDDNEETPSPSPVTVDKSQPKIVQEKVDESPPVVTQPPPLNNDQQQQPSETQWKVFQLKPDIPPHHISPGLSGSYLIRRESKTLAGADMLTNIEESQTPTVYSQDPIIIDENKQESIVTSQPPNLASPTSPVQRYTSYDNSSSNISEYAAPTSPRFPKPITANFASTNTSKYAKVSYHLTNDPTAIKKYREMAEKTNDTTTQLMFAKYLLETANAFQQQQQQSTAVVGSMWGLGSTTKKSQRPEPYLVVPPPNDNGTTSSSRYSTSSLGSSSNQKTKSFDVGSLSKSSIAASNYQQQSIMNVTMKQQASLNVNHHNRASTTTTTNEAKDQKRKLLEQEGIKWITKLAKQNVPEACYMQASWMDKELYGFKKNKTKSIALHHIAAKANIPESVFAIADYYEHDEGGNIEPARIVKFYQAAADFGYVNAIYRLAFITIHGQLGQRQSLTEGLKLMYKACTLASEEFNVPPYTFALMLTNEYEEVDFPQPILEPYGGKEAAILYYERAARLNNDQAQSKLGSIYEHGLYGESMNFARAFDYYEQAAINGNAKAMLGLSRLNNRGSHGPGDHNEANRLENDVSGWLAATPVNEDLAFSWCEKAAKAGNVDALSLLGWFYESGFGAPRDFGRAEKYYALAAEKGHFGAKTRLMNTNASITKQQHEGIAAPITDKSIPIMKKKRDLIIDENGKKRNNCRCM